MADHGGQQWVVMARWISGHEHLPKLMQFAVGDVVHKHLTSLTMNKLDMDKPE